MTNVSETRLIENRETRVAELQLEPGDELLRGADEIGLFMFGKRGLRRKVYHLVATSRLPVFRLGSMICARKSVLLRWIAAQERTHWRDE
jgi:hypothetical protein